MKLISWNVNGIRATYKKGLTQFLAEHQPDIFCVQETKAHPDQLEAAVKASIGPIHHWSAAERKGYSGVATFMKESAAWVDHGIGIDRYDKEGRFIITRHEAFDLYNVYFPNGASGPERQQYKMEFLRDFTAHLSERLAAGGNIILVGDYNIAPAPIDIYDPVRHARTSGFLPQEREWYQQFLSLGFVDTFRHFHPETVARYTWWNQMERARLTNKGWRIDMICVSKGLVPKVVAADILEHVEGSDHCPVMIEMKDVQ